VHKSGREFARRTEVCVVAPNICGFSVWNLLQANLLAHRFLKILCTSSLKINMDYVPKQKCFVILDFHRVMNIVFCFGVFTMCAK
jgi:hypothetical protein